MQFLNRVGAPLILTARIIEGGGVITAHLLRRQTKSKVGPGGLLASLGPEEEPGVCAPAAAPAHHLTLTSPSSHLVQAGRKPVQMGILSVTTAPASTLSCRCRPRLGGGGHHTAHEAPRPVRPGMVGASQTFPACPCHHLAGPSWDLSAQAIAGCSCGGSWEQ